MKIYAIISAVVVALLALLGVQRGRIRKQKEVIKEKEKEIKVKEVLVEASEQVREKDKELTEKQTEKVEEVKGAKDEKEIVDILNNVIDRFNR